MQVIDTERSEYGPQRRRTKDGRRLHCCCICGKLDTWNDYWSYYTSYKEMENDIPYPKFCSTKCREIGGTDAMEVTGEMRRKAKDAEWREPETVYREATDCEKYNSAADAQKPKQTL